MYLFVPITKDGKDIGRADLWFTSRAPSIHAAAGQLGGKIMQCGEHEYQLELKGQLYRIDAKPEEQLLTIATEPQSIPK